jgi:hypothetical protein
MAAVLSFVAYCVLLLHSSLCRAEPHDAHHHPKLTGNTEIIARQVSGTRVAIRLRCTVFLGLWHLKLSAYVSSTEVCGTCCILAALEWVISPCKHRIRALLENKKIIYLVATDS